MAVTVLLNTDADLTPAGRLLARFEAEMPADIVIHEYDVSDIRIIAQLDAGFRAESSARLRSIADLFGLTFNETADRYVPGRLDLTASGTIDGIDVRFWDNVPVATPKPRRIPSCTCHCHGSGGAA